jgi:putative SOS response-associated peptidase YedK
MANRLRYVRGAMPGRFYLTHSIAEQVDLFGSTQPDFVDTARLNIWPGQLITVCDPSRALRQMRWGMIPVGRVNARGRPVMATIVNARSETVFDKSAFLGVHRASVRFRLVRVGG